MYYIFIYSCIYKITEVYIYIYHSHSFLCPSQTLSFSNLHHLKPKTVIF